MSNILIIAHFAEIPEENDNCRFAYIANLLYKRGHKVEIIASKFSHAKKIYRKKTDSDFFTLIDEPHYKKNVSIKRVFSHKRYSKNVKKYLRDIEVPDLIYCAVPSLDVARVAQKYARNNDVKFVIDIQDLWPEAFQMVFNVPVISDIVFWPFTILANKIYADNDMIVAVSDTYKERASSVDGKNKYDLSVFLGTELKRFDNVVANGVRKRNDNEFWIGYVGTLGHSYDLKTVIKAISILDMSGIDNIRFIVMGDGPLQNQFEHYAKELQVKCNFVGRLPYEEMILLLKQCDIAVNPIFKGAAQSIINKVGDYAAASLPVLNTQECVEYRDLIETYRCGYNCKNSDAEDLAEKILLLYSDKKLVDTQGKNSRKLAVEKFDRPKTYQKIIEAIEKLCDY